MRKELENSAAEAVDIAKKAGANEVWAGANRSRSVSFRFRDGKLEEVKDSTSRGLGVRLYVDGRYSAHSTTDLRPERIRSFVEEAVALTRALQPDKFREIPDPALFKGRPDAEALDLVDRKLLTADRDQRIGWCKTMNERVVGKDKVISVTSNASDSHSIAAAVSSNGFSGVYEATSVGMYTTCTLNDGDKRPEDWMATFGRHLDGLSDPEAVADEALANTRARLGTAKGPTQRTVMVVDRRAGGSLIGRLLGPANGGSVQQERSFWRGNLGKKMVSEVLTITDDPLVPRGLASRPFDSEGIAARRMPVIENGVFKNYYLDTYYAKKLSMQPTTGSSSNRILVFGTRGRDQIIAAVGKGVYVTSWLGGNMDSTTGDFSFGVRGHLIENGKIGAPVGEMNVTGNILELFKELRELGNDPWPYSSAPTPTMVFDGVQFSGV